MTSGQVLTVTVFAESGFTVRCVCVQNPDGLWVETSFQSVSFGLATAEATLGWIFSY